METQDENRYRRRLRNNTIGLIVLAIILVLAILAIVVFMTRIGRLSEEQQQLQDERTGLLEERQQQTSELIRSDSILTRLQTDFEELTALNEENLRTIMNQSAGLQRRSAENQALDERLETYRLIESEYEKFQAQHAALHREYENLDLLYDKLESRYNSLRDSVNQSKGLKALNISILSKWERWLWADRYNVSQARRIDETRISFEIWGSPFTPSGERTVYISMIDPSGSIMYPVPADTDMYDGGEGLPYTKKQEVNFTGNPLPVTFTIAHPERLDPGTYTINVYIDADAVGSERVVYE